MEDTFLSGDADGTVVTLEDDGDGDDVGGDFDVDDDDDDDDDDDTVDDAMVEELTGESVKSLSLLSLLLKTVD